MFADGKAFVHYAKAERELCEMAGKALTDIINEIESRHGIRIAELRVTMDRAHSLNGWPAANCVMVREEEAEATMRRDVGNTGTGEGGDDGLDGHISLIG